MEKIKEREKTKNKIWNLTKKLLGVIFIIVGIAGLFLPFLQGILFILIGLALYYNKNVKEVTKKVVRKVKKVKKNFLKLTKL